MAHTLTGSPKGSKLVLATAPASPGMNRLDRVLELVTDHEARTGEQDMRIAELLQRMTGLEARIAQQMEPVAAIKDRNIPKELDMARMAVETLVRQMANLNRSNQDMKEALQAGAKKQEAWQLAADAAHASLSQEVGRLTKELATTQEQTRKAVEQLRHSVTLQLEAHHREVEERIEAAAEDIRQEVRQLTSSGAGTQVRDLEVWTRGELLSLAGKLKTVVTTCAGQQDQTSSQLHELHRSGAETREQVEQLAADGKKLKKALGRLQTQTEDLERSGSQALPAGISVVALRNDVLQLQAGAGSLAARAEATAGAASQLGQDLRETNDRMSIVERAVLEQHKDMTALAEHVGSCLAAANEEHPSATSYLSSLLAPVAASYGPPPGALSRSVSSKSAWEQKLDAFDDMVDGLKQRLASSEESSRRLADLVSSPRRRSPRLVLGARRAKSPF